MNIRVRELRAYLDANPRLEEYDAPLLVTIPATIPAEGDVEIELTSITVVRTANTRESGSRLALEFAASTESEFCTDRCKENVKVIDKAKKKLKDLIDRRRAQSEQLDWVLQALEDIEAVLDGEE